MDLIPKLPLNTDRLAAGSENVFLPNILDLYDSSTYNLKLFMVSEDDIKNNNILGGEQEVIAQSGVTSDVFISDLEILSVPGLSDATLTGTSIKYSFKLTQVLGADLMDRIYDSSHKLGIHNYNKVPYFLQLRFKARTVSESADASDLAAHVWLWPIVITTVGIKVNAGGSIYDMEAAVYDDLAYTNEYGNIDKSLQISASTVNDYFNGPEGLSHKLAERQLEKQASGQAMSDEWLFEFDADIGDASIVASNPDQNAKRNGSFIEDSDNKTMVQFNDGTDILRAIDSILSNTSLFQKKVKGTSTEDQQPTPITEKQKSEFKKLYRVYCRTEIIGFDIERQDYARKFHYYIKYYDIPTVIGDVIESGPADDQLKIDTYISKGYLKKRYDYIYTGLNDQIISFDLDFNFAWYAARAKQAGINTDSSALDSNKSQLAPSVQQDQKTTAATKSLSAKIATESTTETSRGKPVVALMESQSGQGETVGIESKTGPGRNIISTLFNQATENSDMISIELEIKGDPFWLEPAPRYRSDILGSLKEEINRQRLNGDTGVFTKEGEVFLLFNSQTPTLSSTVDSNRSAFSSNSTLNGVYKLIKVTSRFNDGKFTQTLECVRDVTVDTSKTDISGRF